MQPAGLLEVVSHGFVAKDRTCMTAKSMMDVNQGRHSNITVENFGMADIYLPKDQNVGEVAIAPE